MSALYELLNEKVKQSQYTISNISQMTGIERSYLSKILAGKRKMTIEYFCALAEALYDNVDDRMKLIDMYISEVFGKERFDEYFGNMTSDIAAAKPHKKTVTKEITDDFILFKTKAALTDFGKFFISNENKNKRVYANLPVGALLTVAVRKDDNCDFRCIINPDTKDRAVSIFDLIKLNLICCTGYVDENAGSTKYNPLFYPYFIIGDDGILFANKDFNKGYYIGNPELADMYAKEFVSSCKKMKINSYIHNDVLNVKEPIAKYLFNRQVHRVLNNNLSVVAFMTRKDWEELARPELADRGYLINTTYEYYQEFFNSIESHIFIAPVNGLADFCETGRVHEMPVEYSRPLSIETRIALLERMVDYIKNKPEKYKLNFLKSTNLEKIEIPISIESTYDPNANCKTTLITLSTGKSQETYFPGNYLFLSTDDSSIYEYNTFFDLVRISDKCMSKSETLAVLEDRILRLKYAAKDINTATEEEV